MPTLEHNALVEMFRENPALAPHLLALVFHQEVPPHASVRVADSALDRLIPVEFRADLVLELLDGAGKPLLAIVLEAQRGPAPRKKYTWPVYCAVARAERECPAIVLVISPDAEVAAWAAETIDLGLGRGAIQPFVLGPATLPLLTDPAMAANEVELAVLSAMAHGNGPEGLAVIEATVVGLARLDQEHWAVYFQMLWKVLREPMQRALEALVMQGQVEGGVPLPAFLEKMLEARALEAKLEGLRDGEIKGLRDGEIKGLRDGKLDALRSTLLRLLARAGIAITVDESARIQACKDAGTLERWIENVLGAKSAADVLS
jgi:hypothetical protein